VKSDKWIIALVALGLSIAAPAFPATKPPVPADFEGDGRSDLALWDPETGQWRFADPCNSTPDTGCGFSHGHLTGTTGAAVAVPADYDGDGRSDPAYYDPARGQWRVVPLPPAGPQRDFQLGEAADIPVPADYDGDGLADPAVFRPSDGTWRRVSGVPVQFGLLGDRPVPADYDGDGIADLAVFRPGGTWIVWRSSDGAVTYEAWGVSGDVPVPGDYDGDGLADPAVFRGSLWWIQRSRDGAQVVALGSPGDIPVPADYNGDGAIEPAVYRPPAAQVGPQTRGLWLIAGRPAPISFGEPRESPVLAPPS